METFTDDFFIKNVFLRQKRKESISYHVDGESCSSRSWLMRSWEVWLSQSLRLFSYLTNLVRALPFVRNIDLYSNSKIKVMFLIPKPEVNIKRSDFTLQVLLLR